MTCGCSQRRQMQSSHLEDPADRRRFGDGAGQAPHAGRGGERQSRRPLAAKFLVRGRDMVLGTHTISPGPPTQRRGARLRARVVPGQHA
jgi:hypothetical protein